MGPKKAKLTKAEKQALKLAAEENARLEQERLLKEAEEEARRKAEEEESLRKELEKIRLEEEVIRKEDRSRLSEIVASIIETYKKDLKSEWKKSQWYRYVNVWKVMNPFSLPMVNTFLSEWDEEENYNFKSFFARYHQCMKIIEELEAALLNCPKLTVYKVKQWNEILTNVKNTITRKVDFITFNLLQNGADYLSPDSYNMECCITDAHIDDVGTDSPLNLGLCLWINFAKNVRFKGMMFPDLELSFELPDTLVTQPCAVRILHTLFDVLICHESEHDSLLELPEKDTELQEKAEDGNLTQANGASEGEKNILPEVQSNEITPVISKPPMSENEGTSSFESSSEPLPLSESSTTASKVDSSTSIISSITVHVTPSATETRETKSTKFPPPKEPEMKIVDNDLYFSAGGTFYMDLMQIPVQPLCVGSWCLIFSEEKILKRIPYKTSIIPIRQPQPHMSPLVAAEFADFEITRYEKEIAQAISISLRLPKTAIYVEKPTLAFWLEKERAFTTNGFFDVQLDDEMLSFKANQFGKFALLQRKHSNLPYTVSYQANYILMLKADYTTDTNIMSWKLTMAQDKNSAILTITGAMLQLELQISSQGCCVYAFYLDGKKVLEDQYFVLMTPAELTEKLISVGINIKFDEVGLKKAGFQLKNQATEQWVYACMSVMTDVFSFSSSPWNSVVTSDKIIFRCNRINDELQESFLVMVDEERALRLMSTDDTRLFSDEYANSKFCSDLYQLLMYEADKPLYQPDTNIHFSINLHLLLDSCKIMSCS